MNRPGPIDLLLGADVYALILLDGLKKHGSLIAQNSRLGWLVSGTANSQIDLPSNTILVSSTQVEVDQLLRKFWETEEYQINERSLTLAEKKCEEHYKSTYTRNHDGRYVVRLPFKDEFEERLGDSYKIALTRLNQMENRFIRNPKFREGYEDFLEEYKSKNHLEDVDPKDDNPAHKVYYLPHHAVIRESSTTTKLRVVFDGSAQPSGGTALNDELLIGPSLLEDLRDLTLRCRTHKICFLADVKQMYRQILVSREDADYQRILWRPSPNDDIVEKRLLTVTYGTSCAPFLAIRTLKQLALDEMTDFTDMFHILNNGFYKDDLLSGANDEKTAITIKKRVTEIMKRGQFEMHKWASNSTAVLKDSETSSIVEKSVNIIKTNNTVKALGVKWNTLDDNLEFNFDVSKQTKPFGKTTVLSDIARAFDPLGILGPVVIKSKIFLQKLWLSGIGWNDELPHDLALEWAKFTDQLVGMKPCYLNRWINTKNDDSEQVEVHGFSDASCLAYAAAVYVRVVNEHGIYMNLVLAKTKVAPVKQISLPRLELCGAVLLSKLIRDVQKSLKIFKDRVFAWTDSMIVLSWLRKNPNVWKPQASS